MNNVDIFFSELQKIFIQKNLTLLFFKEFKKTQVFF